MIIGLTGLAGVGKDSAAHILADQFGFEKLSFATPVKELLLEISDFIRIGGRSLTEAIATAGTLEKAKRKYPEVRRAMRAIGGDEEGTCGARKVLGRNVWVYALQSKLYALNLAGKNVVITDVSYQNEFDFIVDWNGTVVEIFRTGFMDQRVSGAPFPADAVPAQYYRKVMNNGTRADLAVVLAGILGV